MEICGKCDSIVGNDGICWTCYRHTDKPKDNGNGNTSTNYGIPEKKRGWEKADMQYHGDMFHSGEW